MKTSWQMEMGHLAWRWSEVGQRVKYSPEWMQQTSEMQSGYLPPITNFASHSPFAGATWFHPHDRRREFE